MPSRVIHARVPDDVIVGCMDALTIVARRDLNGRPLSTIITTVLEGFISSLQKDGQIPDRDEAEVKGMIDRYLMSDIPSFPPSHLVLPPEGNDIDEYEYGGESPTAQILDKPEEDDEGPEEYKEEDMHAHLDAIAAAIAKREDVSIPLKVEKNPEPVKRKGMTYQEMQTIERLHLEELRKVAPKDQFILASEDSDYMTLAVEIAYTKLPQRVWGTEQAGQVIEGILKQMDAEV